jgi:hypothetical protein
MDFNKGKIMVMETDYATPETKSYKCYKIGQVLYVPHYNNPGIYIGPSTRQETGFIKGKYTARLFYKNELIKMGATEVIEQLWSTAARDEK